MAKHAAQELIPTKRSLVWLWILLGVLGVLIIGTYAGGAYYFSTHFGLNTIINGTTASFRSVEEVEQSIAADVATYQLRIDAREYDPVWISSSQVGLAYVPNGAVAEVLQAQNYLLWPIRLFGEQGNCALATSITYDSGMLDSITAKYPFFDASKMKPPVNARVEFAGAGYTVVPEYEGTTVNITQATEAINKALSQMQPVLTLSESGCYAQPTLFSNDPTLISKVDLFNRYVPFSITYTFGDTQEVLDGNTTIDWVDTNAEPGELSYDVVAAWVAGFAQRHDTLGHERDITNPLGEKKRVDSFNQYEGGTYGWEIDQETEVWAILESFSSHGGEVREPYYLQRAASYGPQDWGTTYVEVDIGNQHLWYFVDGQIVLETDVTTGLTNGERDTPTGVFTLFQKTTNQRMRGYGPGGNLLYDEVCAVAMHFTVAGHYLHDSPRPVFGGDVYTWNGSHGCVNMPPSKALELFPLIEIGTAVVIHF